MKYEDQEECTCECAEDIEHLGPQFLMIPWDTLDKEFYNWIGTPEARVWFRMCKSLIRRPMRGRLGSKIFNEYYKKGLVCMHWKQEDIAKDVGHQQSYVSKLITSLTEKGIVKKHFDVWNNRQIIIYELGTHDKTVSKHENMHLYTYMAEQKLKSFK